MLRDLSSQQRELAEFMSSISGRLYCAGWINGLEFKLWRATLEERAEIDQLEITNEEVCRLQELCARCGGWIVFDDKSEEIFIPLAEWQVLVENTSG
ncbi:MAG TPA: hypothetical protein VGN95_12860 [Pyrinomonadaceae bacterium]|jgi:hypothetical protein|nr:hypothetical protein [Pyrinomonadaceae bacterium]